MNSCDLQRRIFVCAFSLYVLIRGEFKIKPRFVQSLVIERSGISKATGVLFAFAAFWITIMNNPTAMGFGVLIILFFAVLGGFMTFVLLGLGLCYITESASQSSEAQKDFNL